MKAVVKVAPGSGHVAYTDHPDPEVRPGQVIIEVRAAGVCGTDISLHNWTESMVREFRPHPPLVMGHEFAGVVCEVGTGVTSFKAGDRVTANPIWAPAPSWRTSRSRRRRSEGSRADWGPMWSSSARASMNPGIREETIRLGLENGWTVFDRAEQLTRLCREISHPKLRVA